MLVTVEPMNQLDYRISKFNQISDIIPISILFSGLGLKNKKVYLHWRNSL